MQNYERLYNYIQEYQELVYKYYSRHAVAFLVEFYNLDIDNTVWDDEKLFGGSYSRTGEYTGQKFVKYKMLPVYFVEQIPNSYDGSEVGMFRELESSIVIPGSYEIRPIHGSFLKFDQSYMMKDFNDYPIFIVTGIEKSTYAEVTFWKLKIEGHQSTTQDQIEDQVSNTYVFLDYDKKLHDLNDASFITKMMYKHSELKDKLEEKYFDYNSGFYLA